MISVVFQNWLKNSELKKDQTAYTYSKAIYRISRHYSEQIGQRIDLYVISDLVKLKEIAALYNKSGKYSKFGDIGNGTNRAAINALCRFMEVHRNINMDSENENDSALSESESAEMAVDKHESYTITNFSYEKDLKNSIIFQIADLFPDYKIYGDENEGVEYLIEGKRIDILLEKQDNSLLIIELKSGTADFKVFGQISMYLGLMLDRFPDRMIRGCIIAGEIDSSLRSAVRTSDRIDLMTYTMKLELNKE